MSMKLYKRKDRKNLYVRHKGKLISLGTPKKGWADQLLEEFQAKRLGIYRVPRKRLDTFIEPYLTHCEKFNKETTIDDKKRTLNAFKEQTGNPWLGQINKKTVESFLDSEDVPAVSYRSLNGRPDDRIKGGAVTSTGENADFHAEILVELNGFLKLIHRPQCAIRGKVIKI